MKTEIFKEEIELINDIKLREFVIYCLERVPEYFWKIPASSTGKYHPQYSLGEQGLIRHTKSAILWYLQLCRPYEEEPQDTAIIALILHDSFKCGEPNSIVNLNQDDFLEFGSKTVKNHPELASKFVLEKGKEFLSQEYYEKILEISNNIQTHMGIWGDKLPISTQSKLVALSDYCASRKIHEQISEGIIN